MHNQAFAVGDNTALLNSAEIVPFWPHMGHEPKPTHPSIGSRYDRPYWHTVLAMTDKVEAEAALKMLGKSGRLETFAPGGNVGEWGYGLAAKGRP